MWGKGYLQGTQSHLNFLPEKQTDFIFTMLGEEFGLVGGLAVLALLGLIVLGAMVIALRCRHQYGRLLALGIGMNFFLYVFVNVAMVMGVDPGRRRAAAAGFAWRLGDDHGDGRVRAADVGARAPRRGVRRRRRRTLSV